MTASHPRLSEGRYIVQRCIGTGGMGAVFLAFDDVLKGPRAVKVLKPSLSVRADVRARFRTEAIAMSKLNHPGIVRVFDQGHEGLTSFIVMEYLPGGSLHQRTSRQGPLARDVALCACLDVADALAHAHGEGIIHRDIKPANLLIGPAGVKLTDFGLARVTAEEGGLTRTGATFGTPAFMPPEQRLDGRKTQPASDLYSLCATLFVLLTGEDPIDLYEPDARRMLLDGMDPRVADVIRRGCQADPDERHPDAAALAAALEAARELPGSPRARPVTSSSSTEARPPDLARLQQLWRSYTTPAVVSDGTPADTQSLDTYLPETGVDGVGGGEAASSVMPAAPFRADGATRAARPAAEATGRWGRWLPLAVGLGGLLAGVAALQPWAPSASPQESAPPAALHPAETALLNADLAAASQAFESSAGGSGAGPELLALRGILDASASRPHAAKATFRRAAAEATGSGPRDLAVRLADVTDLQVEGRTPPADSPAVTERLAGWAAVREGSTDPFVDMLFLVSMRTLLPEGRLAVELSRAREAHPELAIFGLLRSRLQEDLLDFDQQRAVLDEVHIAFPSVTAIQVDRARLLLRGGEQDAAREALQHAVRLQPDAFEPTALLADLAAGAGDEAARMRHLVTVLSDTTPASQQREFLLQHGETMASLGCPREATRIWTADLTMPADLTAALRVAAGVRRSRVAVLLHDAPDAAAAQTGAARALLPRGAGSLAQREAWEAELVYDDGVRAMRTGVSGAYEAALSVLSSSASSPDAPRRTHELAALLALEGALGVREPDLSTLDAALQTHRPALAGYCSMHWIDARAAELRGDLAALTRAATAIGSGACRGRVLERGVYTAETHARLASVAAEAGEAARAAEAIAAFHAHWPAPEGDVPLVATMEALQPSSR